MGRVTEGLFTFWNHAIDIEIYADEADCIVEFNVLFHNCLNVVNIRYFKREKNI